MAATNDGRPPENTLRVGRPRKSPHEKRRKQQQATKWRDARRVYLGNSYDRWKKVKARVGLKDHSLAWHLMEAHDSHCVECGRGTDLCDPTDDTPRDFYPQLQKAIRRICLQYISFQHTVEVVGLVCLEIDKGTKENFSIKELINRPIGLRVEAMASKARQHQDSENDDEYEDVDEDDETDDEQQMDDVSDESNDEFDDGDASTVHLDETSPQRNSGGDSPMPTNKPVVYIDSDIIKADSKHACSPGTSLIQPRYVSILSPSLRPSCTVVTPAGDAETLAPAGDAETLAPAGDAETLTSVIVKCERVDDEDMIVGSDDNNLCNNEDSESNVLITFEKKGSTDEQQSPIDLKVVKTEGSKVAQTDILGSAADANPDQPMDETERELNNCHVCTYKTSIKGSMTQHIKSHNPRKIYHDDDTCDTCGKGYIWTLPSELRTKDIHEGPWRCNFVTHGHKLKVLRCQQSQCTYKTFYKSNLTRHLKCHITVLIHRPPRFMCDQCGKVFRGRSSLRLHLKNIHEASWRFTCKVCGKGYNRRDYYNCHLTKHNASLRLKCSLCPSVFSWDGALKIHFQSVHDCTGRHICTAPGCDATFTTVTARQEHKRVKHSDKPLTLLMCKICGKGYRWRSSLLYHKNKQHPVMFESVPDDVDDC